MFDRICSCVIVLYVGWCQCPSGSIEPSLSKDRLDGPSLGS